jgi:hypothetical protein
MRRLVVSRRGSLLAVESLQHGRIRNQKSGLSKNSSVSTGGCLPLRAFNHRVPASSLSCIAAGD